MPWDLLVHGGSTGVIIFGAYVCWKVNKRLDRDESLKADYPPHRHINGKVLYPKEYEPSVIEKLQEN